MLTDDPATRRDPAVIATRWTGFGRAFAIIGGVVLTVAALKLGRTVLVPLVAGLFLAVLARPLHRRLHDALPRRMEWVALLVAMLAIIAGVAAFGAAVGWSVRAVAGELRDRRPQIERQLASVRERASHVGVRVPELPGASASGSPAAQQPGAAGTSGGGSGGGGGGGGGGNGQRTLVGVVTGIGELILALAFAALAMAETPDVRRRIAHLGRAHGGHRALEAMDEIAPAFRRYVWVKSITSALTGVVTALIALAFGLPLAWVWGFLAFLFEYVPTVGTMLAIAPPVLMALAEGGVQKAGLVLLVVGTAQVVLGNVIDPKLEGRMMSVSPFGVLLSIVFWGWLWGAVGALLAVPLTVAVVIAARHIPGMRGVATVVAGDGVPDEDEGEGASGKV